MAGTPIRTSSTAVWSRSRERRPAPGPLQLLAAAIFLVAVAAGSELGVGTSLTPLVVLPVVWFALHDARLELLPAIAGAALAATLPGLSGAGDETGAVLAEGCVWLVSLSIAGYVIARYVRGREGAIEGFAVLARTDPLTGLANRRAWTELLRREIARARRDGSSFSVALVDLDRFKAFNDRHGHAAGDRLLKEAAARWSGQIREMDLIARHGGEEFALLLPGAAGEDAVTVIERIRRNTPESITASGGVAEWDGQEDPDELLARADAALYRAKRGGRDQIRVAQRSVTSSV